MRAIPLLLMPLALALSACGGKDKDDLAALDAQLMNNASDPAVQGALESPIVVDPQLARQSNALSVKPADRPVNGQVPMVKGPAPSEAELLKLVGGRMLHAPAATEAKPCPKCSGHRLTLGALAREQGQRAASHRSCNAPLAYGMEWAERLPEAFQLYPGAQLTDAAGTDKGCALRGVSFRANASIQAVIDFYYTQARRAGYDATHEMIDGDHVLGGTRRGDDGAFLLTFAPAPGGGTDVDMILSGGR